MKKINWKHFLYFSIILLAFASACKNEPVKEIISNKKIEAPALDLINKCITAHGGIEKWNAIKEISYTKNFVLFDSTNTIERMLTQKHHYELADKKNYTISWKENNEEDLIELQSVDGKLSRKRNGEIEEVPEKSLFNSLQSSLFVIGLPYKLLDDGPVITYEGIEKAWNGREAHVVKAVYDPTGNNNLTTADTWWFLIDKENYRMIGNRITHLDHRNRIKNSSWNEVDGFSFYRERESYRIDENDKDLFLRATYLYENFEVK